MGLMKILRRVRWACTLPVVAAVVTCVLIRLAVYQNAAFWATHPGLTDTPGAFQTPATLLAQVLNGPGFFLPWPFGPIDNDWLRLPGVVVFWTWLGLAIDRRIRSGPSAKLSTFRRRVFNAAMLGLAAALSFGFLRCLHGQQLLPTDSGFHSFFSGVPWAVRLHLTASGWYVGLAWSLVYVLYFACSLFFLLRQRASVPADSSLRQGSKEL
jgi:hypothetical protein